MTVSRIERGQGGRMTVEVWQRIGIALDRPLRLELGAAVTDDVADAGHLVVQELILRYARGAGHRRAFELPTRPSDPARSVDVGLRDDRGRVLLVVEAWNTFGDLGAAARSFDRKLAEARRLAIAIGGERPYRVAGCWVIRDTARNRALLRRYPEIFAVRFPGSSAAWLGALTRGAPAPEPPGLVWCDRDGTRLFVRRKRQ